MSAPVLPRHRQAGLLLAIVLLVLRLAVPIHPVPTGKPSAETELAGLLAEIPICHADAGLSPAAPQPGDKPSVPAADCALCPVCQLGVTWALLPAPLWISGPLQTSAAQVAPMPPSTGPPGPERYAAPARGPPASVV